MLSFGLSPGTLREDVSVLWWKEEIVTDRTADAGATYLRCEYGRHSWRFVSNSV